MQFELNQSQLEQQLRLQQSQHHPDKALDSQNLQSQQISAMINQAYQTLRYPDSRASHLLALVGQDDGLQMSITDLDFLDEAMDFRIALDEAEVTTLPSLQNRLNDWIDRLSQDFTTAYQQQSWQIAKDSTQKLKFLVKLDKDLQKKADELANSSQNDDDLYV